MSDTLAAKLERLRPLKQTAREFGIETLDREISDAEQRVLAQFFSWEPLAHNVARGTDSYETRVAHIEERYSSLWRRLRVQQVDENFDREVRRVLGSMNNVGVVCLDTELLTTEGRRTGFRNLNGFGLACGGILGLLMWPLTTNEPYNPEVENIVEHALNTYGHYITVAAAPVLITGIVHPVHLKLLLNLKYSAQATDTFLRQHYVK